MRTRGPDAAPLTGTLLALTTFGVGFLARPLGGLLAGHWGDRYGRRPVLIGSLVVMGASTALVGALPSYARAGVWAPILLVALRLLQGVATGGESGGATVYGVEAAPASRRGRFGSFSGFGQSAGAFAAVIVFTIISAALPHQALLAWGWRVPFLLGGLLTFVSIASLVRATDTRVLTGGAHRRPLLALLRGHLRPLLLATGLSAGINSLVYIMLTFVLTYATNAGWSSTHALIGQIVFVAAVSACIIPVGDLADRFGASRLLIIGSALTAGDIFVLFWAVQGGNSAAFYVNFAAAGAINALLSGASPVVFANIFPPEVRYSGVSASYQVGAALSGFAPAIATAVFDSAHQSPWAVPVLGLGLAAVSVVCTIPLRSNGADHGVGADATERQVAA